MIFGDPEKFAILVEPISSWNAAGDYRNGVLSYMIAGNFFPEKLTIADISSDTNCFCNDSALISQPVHKKIYYLPAHEAYMEMLKAMEPFLVDPDSDPDLDNDYTFQASVYSLEENGYFCFAVSNGKTVRILGAQYSYLDRKGNHPEWKKVDNLNIKETYIDGEELKILVKTLLKETERFFL
jgi:hypothetical protein